MIDEDRRAEISARYDRLAAAMAETVAAVPADRWKSPSPCEDWTALDVVRHVVESQGMFLGLVGRSLPPGPSVDDDPLGAFRSATGQVSADLADPERAGAEYDGMLGRSTFAEAVDGFLCFDLVVHRWDLARAAGLDDRIDPDDVDWVWARVQRLGDSIRAAGVCGPEVEAPEDADPQTRLLAYLGRRAA